MRELAISRIRQMLKIWPEYLEWATNVVGKSWDELEDFSDQDLLNNLERLARQEKKQGNAPTARQAGRRNRNRRIK